MIIYTDTPLRLRKDWDKFMLHQHAWSEGRVTYECYHYNVEDEDGRRLVAEGKARILTDPFICQKEHRK